MRMPGFSAELSAYKTDNHYQISGIRSFSNAGGRTVNPQGCSTTDSIICGSFIAVTVATCTPICIATLGAACAECVAGSLVGWLYPACSDCLPAWIRAIIAGASNGGGSGTGNPPPCCPQGRTCKCGGTCQMVNGALACVNRVCLSPNQKCP